MDVMSTMISTLSPGTVTLIFLAGILYALFNMLRRHPSEYPPMPERPNPMLGHSWGSNPPKQLAKWRENAGDIYSIYFGSTLHIVLNSYELMKEAFVKNGDRFSHRGGAGLNKIRDDFDAGILSSDGPNWKAQRTVSLSILRALGMGKNTHAIRIRAEVENYTKELSGLNAQPASVRALTHVATTNVISSIVLGQRFEYNDPILLDVIEMISELVKIGRQLRALLAFPWLKHLPIPGDPFGAKRLWNLDRKFIWEFCGGFIEKCRQDMDYGDGNFITAYLKKMETDKDSRNGKYIDEIVEMEKQVHQEIVSVVGRDKWPCLQDRPHLNYLNAFILETQRLGSVVPQSLMHQCHETTRLAGYTIPKGAFIIPNLDAVLKGDPVWDDSGSFRPERFLDEDSNLVIPEQFVPFSLGRRACLGESLAKMELFLFLSSVFQRFEICPEDPDNPPELKPMFGTTSGPVDFKFVFKEYTQDE